MEDKNQTFAFLERDPQQSDNPLLSVWYCNGTWQRDVPPSFLTHIAPAEDVKAS